MRLEQSPRQGISSLIAGFFPAAQVARFAVFSGIAAVSNVGAGYLFYQVLGFNLGWQYGLSVAFAFIIGMGVSFMLNRRFTFDASGRYLHEEARTFFLVSIGGLLLTVALSSLLRDALIPWTFARLADSGALRESANVELISHVTAVGMVALYSFAAHKLFSFGKGIRHYLQGPRAPKDS